MATAPREPQPGSESLHLDQATNIAASTTTILKSLIRDHLYISDVKYTIYIICNIYIYNIFNRWGVLTNSKRENTWRYQDTWSINSMNNSETTLKKSGVNH